jgi:hypothetical protein
MRTVILPLKIPAVEHILVASFLGMDSKEFKPMPGGGNEIRLDPSSMALNEIVVIGYG